MPIVTFRLPNVWHARPAALAVALLATVAGTAVRAQDDRGGLSTAGQDKTGQDRTGEDKPGQDMARLFVSLCVENGPESPRVETMATSLGLKTITEMPGVALAPSSPDHPTHAWRVLGAAGVPYALSVASGHDGRKLVEICVLADPAGDGPLVQQALVKKLGFERAFRTEPGNAETMVLWRLKRDGHPTMTVAATAPTDKKHPGIVLSITAITRPPPQ